ncbi:MAG: hypothetical protein SWQ30_06480 [Thermodesulfobacteriota bacterium]|nr:hypothetical protein [Thermodesulfobacteriota bacterium]
MKGILVGIMLMSSLIAFGCSCEQKTAEEKLAKVNELLAQGYEMTSEQKEQIDNQMKQINELMAAGKKKEASNVLSVTICLHVRA